MVRAKAMALTTVVNRSASTVVSSTVLSLSSLMSWGGYYIMLALFNVMAFVFVYYIVPETKGKTLEEMLTFFEMLTGGGGGGGGGGKRENESLNGFGTIMMTQTNT